MIADGYGTVWAVGIRDCSLQRRHQKVLEESASTVLDAAEEQAIRDAAVRLCAAAGYRNAGTVEFLVDPETGSFQFMEVNTRLQVEHPVTEATTGVRPGQAAAARRAGRPADRHTADGLRARGRGAAERRGSRERIRSRAGPAGPPAAARGQRYPRRRRRSRGRPIPADFDSMIAKIVAWGRDRDEAMARLRRALRETTAVVEGGTTNRSFLLTLLDRPEVRSGHFDNHWLDRLTGEAAHLPAPDPVALLVAAVECYDLDEAAERAAFHARAARGGAESAAGVGHRSRLRYRGQQYDLHVYRTGGQTYRVTSGVATADVVVLHRDGFERRLVVGDRMHRVVVVVEGAMLRDRRRRRRTRGVPRRRRRCARRRAGVRAVGARRTRRPGRRGRPARRRREHEDGKHHHRAVRRHDRRGRGRGERSGGSGRADRPHRDLQHR